MNLDINSLVTIVVAIFSSAGFWQWIANNTGKSARNEIANLRKDLERMQAEEEEREIKNARRRILRFSDEILNDIKHSKEYFDSILSEDITAYKHYCSEHPEFPNGKTVLACENIESVYKRCLAEHKFL